MAVVLSAEESNLFTSSTLRRSHSQPKFMSTQQPSFHTSASTSRLNASYNDNYRQPYRLGTQSGTSSAPSSPRTTHADSVGPSYSSTPATNFSLDGHCDVHEEDEDLSSEAEDHIVLPTYDGPTFYPQIEDLEPPASPRTGDSYTASPVEPDSSTVTSRPETPELYTIAEDDTALAQHPTQHVDYLSHDWREEDIWSSWRYIISKRGEYSNSARLENASWRTWMKSKYGLKTVSPETLNWLKDCDVTWLYGPLQTRQAQFKSISTGQGSSGLSRNDSFMNKKPILKKRSMSEVMLQRSLSSSSLLKQATAAVQAQQKDGSTRMARPILHRAATDYITFPFSSRRMSRDTSAVTSTESSGLASPATERKHIHFNEQVKQCIAVEIKGEEDEDEDDLDHGQWSFGDDSDSDDGAIMMKRTSSKRRPLRVPKKPRVNVNNDSKTIAMLPSTTLKYREDVSESQDSAMKHSTGLLRGSYLSPSSSQETLRPSKPSGAFFLGDSDDEADDEEEGVESSVDSIPLSRQSGLHRSASANSLTAEPAGMRRTESGMFMPYEEGEAQNTDGIMGRVIDTVNTARDIAHVIWNVGWKR